ncbi:MAG: 4-hydroxy-3-methylbut-2-enyl diphosphate reductase, partial [Firmicutes bacterium]|nr:4-hydroxy-3-methylbut-2-enyl diphosphate reductase [Bacillota bacterium]
MKRSVDMAEEMLATHERCCSFGHLIHNDDMVRQLEEKGLRIVESAEEISENDAVIVRAHGIGKAQYEALCATGAEVIDATCPKVKHIHEIVTAASEKGSRVLIVGAADHPEVRAICGWCTDPIVVKDVTELRACVDDGRLDCAKPLTMVIQTTQTAANLKECQNFLKKICTNAEIFDTICGATFARQSEAEKLSRFCDAMVVIGGRHSANSQHLYEICAQHCANVQFIEKAAQLDTSAFDHAENIGLTAGASVPAWIIKEVKQKMSDEILKEEMQETPVA